MELFAINETEAICCNPGGRFHGWLFRKRADGSYVSVRRLKKVDPTPTPKPPFCHAGRDGECTWEFCPQLWDGEPMRSGRPCPIDTFNKTFCDEDGHWLSEHHEENYRALIGLRKTDK
jgi:hypothetical protein